MSHGTTQALDRTPPADGPGAHHGARRVPAPRVSQDGGSGPVTSLREAEVARNRATCRLRDAEHWRRLVEARLDLAVAAVADIDDLELTLTELRTLIGMPDPCGRLAESSLLIRLRSALAELDAHIVVLKLDVERATEEVASWLVTETGAGLSRSVISDDL